MSRFIKMNPLGTVTDIGTVTALLSSEADDSIPGDASFKIPVAEVTERH